LKTYTIVGGVDGVGKSSLIGALRSLRNDLGIIIDIDDTTSDQIALTDGITFTKETILDSTGIINTVRQAIDLNYQINLYYIGLSTAEESIKRIKSSVERGGHNVLDSDVTRHFSTRFHSLIGILPYCNSVEFYDNENGFALIAIYRNGEIVFTSNEHPQWMIDLIAEYRKRGFQWKTY